MMTSNYTRFTIIALIMSATTLPASADTYSDNSLPIRFIMTGGFTFGGDTLAKLVFSDGDSEKIKAGQLLYLGAGLVAHSPRSPVSFQTTINYHFDTTLASNGDATFSRTPLEVLGFYHINKLHIGAGLTYHINPKLSVDIDSSRGNVSFEDALGSVFQIEHQFSRGFTAGIRGVVIDYEVNGVNATVNGNHIGLVGTILF